MPKIFNKGLWIFIIVYIAIIYATLPIMRSVLTFLYKTLGKEILSLGVNGILVVGGLSFFIFIFKNSERDYGRLALILGVLIIGTAVAMGYGIPEERVHFLEYGILGYLMLKATTYSWRMPFFASFILVFIVGIGDEAIQWFLPNRVGDMRDVFMNSFGGLLGVCIGRLWYGKV